MHEIKVLHYYTYIHNKKIIGLVLSHTQKTERLGSTKVHPYTSNKLNKSNVKKVRL